jgi:hypothetical protein
MSNFYKNSNNESSLDLFNKKVLYDSKILETGEASLVDFSFAEKAFYGKTNRRFVPIVASQDLIRFKNFRSTGNPQQNIQAFSFVVDAFEAMAQQFKKAQQVGKIDPNDPNLTNLKVFKSYVSHEISYDTYQEQLITSLKNNLNITNINNFNTFIKELLPTLTIVTKAYPLSMPAYVKSKINSLTNTGLSLEIAEGVYDNDEEKISDFVNSRNWGFYVNACNSYGFMIDIGAPWRLVADLDSIAMLGYADRYGLSNTDQILGFGFVTTHNSYYDQLPRQLLRIYNEIVPSHITTYDECGSRVVETERYTLESLAEKYSNDFFLRFYFDLRFSEEENTYSDAEKEKIIKDCIQLSNTTNTPTALRTFEDYVNQPFDYRGSLSYLNKARRLREDT